jgi:ribonuclease G
VNPQVAEALHGEENHILLSLENAIGKQINIYPDHRFHLEQFDILETMSRQFVHGDLE